MIRITRQHNIKCLKCLATPEKLIKIGVYYMCDDCFGQEFPAFECSETFDPKGKGSRTYYRWLKIYFQRSEDEYFDNN